jgi:solute carrier family 25 carnitine/acylcarnitine transporter 20/29
MSGEEAWVDFLSGWLSGGASVLACQPIDTVLTRMQANAVIQPAGVDKVAPRPGVIGVNIFRGMVENFGVASLWRGSSPMIGAVPVQNALLMTGYGAGKRWSESSSGSRDNSNLLLGVFVGGCTGGVLQSFIMSPVRVNLSTDNIHMFIRLICTFRSLSDCVAGGAGKGHAASCR